MIEGRVNVLLQRGTAFCISARGRRLSRKDSAPFGYDSGVHWGNTAAESTDAAPEGTPTKTRRSRKVFVGIGGEQGTLWSLCRRAGA